MAPLITMVIRRQLTVVASGAAAARQPLTRRLSPPTRSLLLSAPVPLLLLVLLACLWTQAVATAATRGDASSPATKLTTRDVEAVRRLLEDEMRAQSGRDEDGQPYMPLIAGFVRLAFHSCLGDRCVGCVNPKERIGNNGLKLAVAAAESVLARTDVSISRADLWALAALAASDLALRNAAEKRGAAAAASSRLITRFRYGRVDCDTAPHSTDNVEFPNPHGSADEQLAFMRTRFDLAPRLVVASLGAHGLGVTRRVGELAPLANWVACADCLDNTFFRDILDRGKVWTQMPLRLDGHATDDEPAFVWREGAARPPRRIKFNCDIGLVKNLSGAAASGRAACNYDACPPSATAEWVRLYASDNDRFVRDFGEALSAITAKGYSAGELLEPERSPIDSGSSKNGGNAAGSSNDGTDEAGNSNGSGSSAGAGRSSDEGSGGGRPASSPTAASRWANAW